MSMAECTHRVPERLILMRHAKSDYPPGVADHDRPLNARGRRDAAVAGGWLAEHRGDIVTGSLTVLVSSARRAQQTWSIAGDGFASGWATEPRIYEASVSTIIDLAEVGGTGTVLIVGHNPTLEQCLRHLTADERVMRTSAIAIIDLDPEHPWSSGTGTLRDFQTPRAERAS